jgi:hypothetical protein
LLYGVSIALYQDKRACKLGEERFAKCTHLILCVACTAQRRIDTIL